LEVLDILDVDMTVRQMHRKWSVADKRVYT